MTPRLARAACLALICTLLAVMPVSAGTIKFQASGGPTELHRLGYFRLHRAATLQITVHLGPEPCILTVDAYRQKDPVDDRFADFWVTGNDTTQSETFAAKPGRYKVKVESNCAAWSFVIAKVS